MPLNDQEDWISSNFTDGVVITALQAASVVYGKLSQMLFIFNSVPTSQLSRHVSAWGLAMSSTVLYNTQIQLQYTVFISLDGTTVSMSCQMAPCTSLQYCTIFRSSTNNTLLLSAILVLHAFDSSIHSTVWQFLTLWSYWNIQFGLLEFNNILSMQITADTYTNT